MKKMNNKDKLRICTMREALRMKMTIKDIKNTWTERKPHKLLRLTNKLLKSESSIYKVSFINIIQYAIQTHSLCLLYLHNLSLVEMDYL